MSVTPGDQRWTKVVWADLGVRLCAILGCVLATLLTGCTSTRSAIEILIVERNRYHDRREAKILTEKTQSLAQAAWVEVASQGLAATFDYERGFKEGFADYLQFGGSGNPPALPPRDYWQSQYQDAMGQAAVHDWFAGFRQGAQLAQASGLRETITVPLAALVSHQEFVPQQLPTEPSAGSQPTPSQPAAIPREVIEAPERIEPEFEPASGGETGPGEFHSIPSRLPPVRRRVEPTASNPPVRSRRFHVTPARLPRVTPQTKDNLTELFGRPAA